MKTHFVSDISLSSRVESSIEPNRTSVRLDLPNRNSLFDSIEPSRTESNRTVLGSISHLWLYSTLQFDMTGNGDGTSSDTPTLNKVDILRQEIQQMREQQAQLVNALGQRVIEFLSTHSEEHSSVHRIGRRSEHFKGTAADRQRFVCRLGAWSHIGRPLTSSRTEIRSIWYGRTL